MEISIIIATLAIVFIPIIWTDFIAGLRDSIKFHKRENTRKKLLAKAAMYLEPYDNIWKHQTLINKNVKVALFEHVILIQEAAKIYKIHSYRKEDIEAVWNTILTLFSARTTYSSLTSALKGYEARNTITFKEKIKEPKYKRVDINNCSEMELTSLPGINIVMAKRIVRKRLEIRGFKTEDEFFEYIKLKEHFIYKLEKLITIKKIKIPKPIKRFKERKVDL